MLNDDGAREVQGSTVVLAKRALDELRRSPKAPQKSASDGLQTDRPEQSPAIHDTVKWLTGYETHAPSKTAWPSPSLAHQQSTTHHRYPRTPRNLATALNGSDFSQIIPRTKALVGLLQAEQDYYDDNKACCAQRFTKTEDPGGPKTRLSG